MPTSLTTVTNGTAINASDLTSYCSAIEWYINEGIVAADLKSSAAWVRSSRVFGPDFTTGIVQNGRLVSGEAHWTRRDHTTFARSVHHSEVNTDAGGTSGKYVTVDGMTRTFAVPTAIGAASDPTHKLRVCMDWYCHELGGDGTVDETTDHCADFALFVDGSPVAATARPLFTASDAALTPATIDLVAAHQYSIRYPVPIATAGVHHVGLRIRMYTMTSTAVFPDWRHIFIWGRSASWSWFSR